MIAPQGRVKDSLMFSALMKSGLVTKVKVLKLVEGEVKFHVEFDLFCFLENLKNDCIQYVIFNASDYSFHEQKH